MKLEIRILGDDAGQRADRYLRRYLADMSLARIQGLFRKKEIKIARKPISRNHLLRAGDILEIYGLPEGMVPSSSGDRQPEISPSRPEAKTGRLPFPILHEDGDLLVVNKPAGMAVHPGTGITPGHSLIELAQGYLGGPRDSLFQPALVHRLDRETSGVLMIAKTGGALRALTAALRGGEMHKAYLALLEGRPSRESGTLHDNLGRIDSRSGGAKAIVKDADGKEAITHYTVVEHHGPRTLVRAIIETGRMHQIRAQFANAGWPLAGDKRYGIPEKNKSARETLGLKRLFLHAERLTWKDGRHERVFSAPLPEDLQRALTLSRLEK